jgi:hypothetical protein
LPYYVALLALPPIHAIRDLARCGPAFEAVFK